MKQDELSSEALRLLAAGEHAAALPLLEQLRDSAPDPLAKCIYLLNEAQCFRGLRDYKTAEQKLHMVEQFDFSNQLQVHVENHRIDSLYEQKRYAEANARSRRLLRERAAELKDPQNTDLLYQVKLGLGFGLVSTFEFEEGIALLSELLPQAGEEDRRRIHYYMGLAYNHKKQQDRAISELETVVSNNAHDQLAADAHYDLAMIYKSREAFGWAKKHLVAAEEMKGLLTVPLRRLYSALAHVCVGLNRHDEARRYAQIAESLPDTPDADS